MSADPVPEPDGSDRLLWRTETVIGNLLRTGVIVSVVFLSAGILLTMARNSNTLLSPEALAPLTHPGAAFPHTLRDVGRELLQLRGRAVMTAGLLFLILTPVARVAASIVAFLLERCWRFVAITAFVLIVLVASFFLGKAG
jgi:uncharacterized membrane protein